MLYRLLSKKVSKEVENVEIEELKFRIDLYKKMYSEGIDFASLCPSDSEKTNQVKEKIRK